MSSGPGMRKKLLLVFLSLLSPLARAFLIPSRGHAHCSRLHSHTSTSPSNSHIQSAVATLSILFSLLNPLPAACHAEETGLLTTTVRPSVASEQSAVQSLKSMLQQYFPSQNADSNRIDLSAIAIPELPQLPLPSFDSSHTISGKELFGTVVSDWRVLATIAGLVYVIDNQYSTKELKLAKEERDQRIEELLRTVDELEHINSESQAKLTELEMNAKHLNEEVFKLQAELSTKFQRIQSLESQIESLQQSNQGVTSTVNQDLTQALKRVQMLEAEKNNLQSMHSQLEKEAKQSAVLKSREDEVISSIKSFLLAKGFISQGVANMMIPGTLPGILQECLAVQEDSTTISGVANDAEKDELQQKLENSKKLIAKLHDQLAEANLQKTQSLYSEENTELIKQKTATLEAEILRLKDELAASLQSQSKTTKTASKRDDSELKKLKSQLLSNEEAFEIKLKQKDEELSQLRENIAELMKNLEVMQNKLDSAFATSTTSSQDEMEEYLSQLKAENDDLRIRLLSSDDKLLELTNDMQKKLDNAKDMAKRLNAQMLSKVSEFEKREAQSTFVTYF